ncbi:MAG: hypothetical protein ACFFG0_07220 [Candidatus Thorarchaeota archaeon]
MIFIRSKKIIDAKTLVDNAEYEEILEYINDLRTIRSPDSRRENESSRD